jgi:hypothetical protein
MRSWILIIALLGLGCVDLAPPPELNPPPGVPGPDDAAAAAIDGPDDPAGPSEPDAAAADVTTTVDTPQPLPDAGVDAASAGDAAQADAAALEAAVTDLPLPPADAPAPPDAAATPDAATAPDRAADLALAPDLAPDLARDLAPDLAPDLAADLAPDLGTPDAVPAVLVVDDFQAALTTRNNLNSEVGWDHETCARVNGESVCSYAGSGGFHDFIETFNNWCAFDVTAYSKLRFRLRTSMAGEVIDVYAGVTPDARACTDTSSLLGTITSTTTMTTYSFDISALARTNRLTRVELDPRSTSNAQFILDDVQLVP